MTANVHEALLAKVAPERLTIFVACVAVIVPPPHEPVRPLGVEMIRPAGSVSVKPTPERLCAVLVFCSVKLSVVEPFKGMVATPKDLAIVGGVTTVSEAVDVLPVPTVVEDTVTLLFFTPALVAVTFNDTVQDALPARVPAERLADVLPAAAVAVPPQVLVRLFGVATTKPDGKLSVKARPARAMAEFGF